MALLSRLFGSKPKKTPAPTKKIELSELSAPDLLEIINNTEQTEDYRVKAIQRLTFGEELLELVKTEANGKIQIAAAKRTAKLIDENTLKFDELDTKLSEEKCLTIASYCKNSEYITKYIESEKSEITLAELAIDGPTSKIRQAAAMKVLQAELLLKIQKEIKTKDKNVYKIVKDKIDQYKKEEKTRIETDKKFETICVSLESLSESIDTATFSSKLKHYEKQWNELEVIQDPGDFKARYDLGIKKCQDREHQIEEEKAKANAKEFAENKAKTFFSDSINQIKVIIAQLYSLSSIEADELEKANASIKELENNWHESLSNAKPSKTQSELFKTSITQLRNLIEHVSTLGTLTTQIENLESADEDNKETHQKNLLIYLAPAKLLSEDIPQQVITARTAIEEYETKVNIKKEKEQANLRQLGGLIRKVNSAINQGNLRQASGLRKAINERLEEIENLPKRFNEQIEELDSGIEKLQDYRNFATEPKKLELISSMEILANQSRDYLSGDNKNLDREDLADQIKKLQSDWKELVYGGKDTQPELWEKFHDLSQQAYEPCKEFFNEKSEERQANLEKRKQLLNQVETYLEQYNWELADWKDVETVLRTAKKEWSSYSPVERSTNAPIQKSFNAVLNNIQKLIDEEFQRNKRQKEVIVESAEKLLEIDNIDDAIEKVKSLQTKWKSIGKTWQKEENKLWKTYRDHCDSIFERKDKEREEFKSELDKNRKAAEEICHLIESFSKETGQTLIDKRAEVESLSTSFSEITPLPKNKEKELQRRFSSALDSYEDSIQKDRVRQESEIWNKIFELKECLNKAQFNTTQENLTNSLEKVGFDSIYSKIEKWPSGVKGIFDKIKAQSEFTTTSEEREKSYKLLCIRLETSFDVSTPEEDQTLRMEYQVTRLKEGLMQNKESKPELKEKLLLDWLSLDPINDTLYKKYFSRFEKTLNS